MLTIESLTSELGLKVAAGSAAAGEREIRWVHITELLDPTPWLSGGELLLTTGIPLENADKQRKFIRLLADAGVAGLGFGTGFDHSKIPKSLITEAESCEFPVFEVPYETPFIAITEAAFSRLVNEQYDVLSRGIAVNERLERLVLQGGGLDEIAREIAAAVGGSSVVLDARGEVLASGGRKLPEYLVDAIREEVQPRGTAAAPFVPSQTDLRGRALAHPVSPRAGLGRGLAGRRASLRGAGRLRAALRPAGRDRGRARADAGAGGPGDRAPALGRGARGDPLRPSRRRRRPGPPRALRDRRAGAGPRLRAR